MVYASAAAPDASRRSVTLPRLREMHARGEPIAMLTSYDASFAASADAAGVDVLLIGDSLGMVVQGHASTLPVTVADVAYHTRCVARAAGRAWVIADLPFGSYHQGVAQAVESSVALMQAGAHMVKLEGGGWTVPIVQALVERGIPVCAHLGLTPQSVHAIGGYRVQGREQAAAQHLMDEAQALAEAGAAMLVLELVPSDLAVALRQRLPDLITIGIGAGAATSGQVLVMHDMLGAGVGKRPRFVHNFADGASSVVDAFARYVAAVKDRSYPDPAVHGY